MRRPFPASLVALLALPAAAAALTLTGCEPAVEDGVVPVTEGQEELGVPTEAELEAARQESMRNAR